MTFPTRSRVATAYLALAAALWAAPPVPAAAMPALWITLAAIVAATRDLP